MVSELMYNPDGPDEGAEWIELYNALSVDVDLSRWRIAGDIQFQFPLESRLAAGAFLVVAQDPAAMAARTDAPVFGPFVGQLDNGGGLVQLLNAGGRVMDELEYDDEGAWPVGADGSGSSLAKFNLQNGSAAASNWMTSATLGGSPGQTNGAVDTRQPDGLRLDEVPGAGAAEKGPFWVEIANLSDSPRSAADYTLRIDGSVERQIPLANVTVAPGERIVVDVGSLMVAPQVDDRLFLLDTRAGRLADAVRVEAQGIGRTAPPSNAWWYTSADSPGQANEFVFETRIVINEIMYHHAPSYETNSQPLVETDLEWIEFYNRGDDSIDISGWQMADGIEFTFPSGTQIGPHQYVLLVSDRDAMLAQFPELDDVIAGEFDGRLSNGGERLRLVDAVGNVADEVHYYDGGRWPELADGGGSSLELIDPDADNARPEAWAASWEGDKSQWQQFHYRGVAREPTGTSNPGGFNELIIGLLDAGDILIDDLRVVEDPDGAAIEHLQNGSFDVDTLDQSPAAWRSVGNHNRSYVTVDPDDPSNQVLRLIATGATEHMSNHAETTFADDAALRRNADVEVSFRARWLAGSPRLNTRLYFNQAAESFVLPIPGRAGTPGAVNGRRVANAGPTFDQLLHHPLIPAADEDVTVTARAQDLDGVRQLTLHYSVNSGDFQTLPMISDDSGAYSATIPAERSGRTVQFYVTAVDGAGATSHFPAAGPESRALYRVGARSAPDGMKTFRLVMTPSDAAFMHTNSNVMSNDRLGGTVVFDDQVFYDVGVRLRGSGYGRNDGRTGFNVNFDPGELFRGVHSSVAVDRGVVLSPGTGQGPVQGIPGASPHELLIHHIANHAGGVAGMYDDVIYFDAPRTTNAGLGLLKMARYGNDYLDSQFAGGSDGSLFELELIYYFNRTAASNPEAVKGSPNAVLNADIRDFGDAKDAYRLNYILKNNRDQDDFSRIIELGKALMLRDEALQAAAEEVMDVEAWMRYQAFQALVGTADTFNMGLGHNLYLYVRPEDDRILPMPWDVDHGFFYNSNASLTGQGGTRFSRLISLPWNERLVYKHLLDLVETTYNLDHLQPWIEHYTQITDQNLSGFFTNYVRARSEFVTGRIETIVPRVEMAITTNGGEDISTDDVSITLEGVGWVDVHEFRSPDDGALLPVRWVSETQWQWTLPVVPGENRLSLGAFDLQGRRVGMDQIVVTGRGRLPGDFDDDGRVTAHDIDLLCAAIGLQDLRFDLTRDGQVDLEDQEFLIRDVLHTTRGDANLDGRFDSRDLVIIFQAGEYEDAIVGNSGWQEGDWNCDGEFTSADLIAALAEGGYET